MAKRILLGVLGVVLGVVVGNVVMMGLHMASLLVHPAPEGVDLMSSDPADQERLHAWIETLPASAFLLAAAAHGLGCMAGAFVASFVTGRRSLRPALVIGALFTLAGVANLAAIPHPTWFPFVDLPLYLVLAYVAGRLALRDDAGSRRAAT